MSSRAIPLENGFSAEIDQVKRDEWNAMTARFADASLYQCWDYDAVRFGERKMSHLVLRFEGDVVAAAQARIVKVPGLKLGAAYVRWGPLCHLNGGEVDMGTLRMALRALRNEFVSKRGLMLRVLPLAFAGQDDATTEILAEEHYLPTPSESPQRTFVIDITAPLSELRKRFKQKWRNCLNRAERNDLQVIEGTSQEMFEDFISLYKHMVERKNFSEPNDINQFKTIQEALPDHAKFAIFHCLEDGSLTGGAICSAIGDTGLYLFGATNEQGMKNKASYLLQRHVIEWIQDQGCRHYNLNGVNKETNPGGFHFKAGLAGKASEESAYIGSFDCHGGIGRRMISRIGLRAVPLIKQARQSIDRRRSAP